MFSNLNYLKNEMIKNGLLKELEANDWLVYLAISAFANEIDLAEVNLVTLTDMTGLDMEDLEFSIFKLNQKNVIDITSKKHYSWFLTTTYKLIF